MDQTSGTDVALGGLIGIFGTFVLIGIHEFGHALVARMRGHRVHEVRIGDVDDVTITAGGFRLRAGRLSGTSDVGGYVIYDGALARPADVLAIALAGPAANLLAAAAVFPLSMVTDGVLGLLLFMWAAANACIAVTNLQARGRFDDPHTWSDGQWARAAWAARRADPDIAEVPDDPRRATSVGPPGRSG